ncbi:MAG: hypothetical protein N2201_04280 [candidate division WOR-3 bacterium]|nr:hypothetical protein [candidate division WOR-3 bacterium]
MRRSVGLIIFIVIISAVIGSVLAYLLSALFPPGPVYNLFFKAIQIGIPQFTLNLKFMTLTFGIMFSITGLTILFIILTLIFLNRF